MERHVQNPETDEAMSSGFKTQSKKRGRAIGVEEERAKSVRMPRTEVAAIDVDEERARSAKKPRAEVGAIDVDEEHARGAKKPRMGVEAGNSKAKERSDLQPGQPKCIYSAAYDDKEREVRAVLEPTVSTDFSAHGQAYYRWAYQSAAWGAATAALQKEMKRVRRKSSGIQR
jgi:hypothetical protein